MMRVEEHRLSEFSRLPSGKSNLHRGLNSRTPVISTKSASPMPL